MPPHRSNRIRKGIAAVEMAVCLPVLMIIAMGTLETTNLISLRQRLLTVAYEAARTATAPGHTSQDGVDAGDAVLTARAINGGSVTAKTATGADVTATTATGTEVVATVVAPFSTNSYIKPFVLAGLVTDVTVKVTMVRQ